MGSAQTWDVDERLTFRPCHWPISLFVASLTSDGTALTARTLATFRVRTSEVVLCDGGDETGISARIVSVQRH